MNEKERNTKTIEEVASELAVGFGSILTPGLPGRVDGLLFENIGILSGIANGKITSGCSRLRDNTFEILDFADRGEIELIGDGTAFCIDMLNTAARNGLTIEGQQLGEQTKWEQRGR